MSLKRVCFVFIVSLLMINAFLLSHSSAQSVASDLDLRQVAADFIGRVGGINLNNYPNASFNAISVTPLHSIHSVIEVTALLENNSDGFQAHVFFADNKFWGYTVDSPQINLQGNKTLNDCLTIAENVLIEYNSMWNSSYCQSFKDMVTTALQGHNRIVENNNAILNVTCTDDILTPSPDLSRFTSLNWYAKIGNGSVTEDQSILVTVSKNGLLTELADYASKYHVATTSISVSKEDAVNMATPYAESDADDHGVKIVQNDTELMWMRDWNASRGDDFALYPAWVFTAVYNETKQGLSGYNVAIWADNGRIYSQGEEGAFTTAAIPDTSYYQWLLLSVVSVVAILVCLGTYLKRKKGRRVHVEHLLEK